MTIPTYVLGKPARARITITSSTDSTVKVDPGGLTYYLKEPDGTTYSYVWNNSTMIVSATAGEFTCDWPTAKEGHHYGGWVGTGSNAGAEEFEFYVRKRLWD